MHLVERHLGALDELDALVEDYLAKAAECGQSAPAPGAWWDD